MWKAGFYYSGRQLQKTFRYFLIPLTPEDSPQGPKHVVSEWNELTN
jgi:hypothetical protein